MLKFTLKKAHLNFHKQLDHVGMIYMQEQEPKDDLLTTLFGHNVEDANGQNHSGVGQRWLWKQGSFLLSETLLITLLLSFIL